MSIVAGRAAAGAQGSSDSDRSAIMGWRAPPPSVSTTSRAATTSIHSTRTPVPVEAPRPGRQQGHCLAGREHDRADDEQPLAAEQVVQRSLLRYGQPAPRAASGRRVAPWTASFPVHDRGNALPAASTPFRRERNVWLVQAAGQEASP